MDHNKWTLQGRGNVQTADIIMNRKAEVRSAMIEAGIMLKGSGKKELQWYLLEKYRDQIGRTLPTWLQWVYLAVLDEGDIKLFSQTIFKNLPAAGDDISMLHRYLVFEIYREELKMHTIPPRLNDLTAIMPLMKQIFYVYTDKTIEELFRKRLFDESKLYSMTTDEFTIGLPTLEKLGEYAIYLGKHSPETAWMHAHGDLTILLLYEKQRPTFAIEIFQSTLSFIYPLRKKKVMPGIPQLEFLFLWCSEKAKIHFEPYQLLIDGIDYFDTYDARAVGYASELENTARECRQLI